MRTVRCGRLDDHDMHTWEGSTEWRGRVIRHVYICPGHTVVEGGHGGVR